MGGRACGRDTLARSKTGSGKTLGFAVPIVERLDPKSSPLPAALVLVPTRELAQQVRAEFQIVATAKHLKVLAVYGGTRVREQAKGAGSVHVLIATPGRLDDLAIRGLVTLDGVRDPGARRSRPDARHGVPAAGRPDRPPSSQGPPDHVLLRHPRRGGRADRRGLHPRRHRHEVGGFDRAVVDEADHRFVPVPAHGKLAALAELAKAQDGLTLVFVNTKRAVDDLARRLKAEGVPALALHGDMRQEARDRSLSRFAAGHVGVLVATDVAARGLDLDDIMLVVNYDVPQDDKAYVHRVGRTARAGRTGTSVTFVTPGEQGDVSRMAARLELRSEFEQEGMKVAPPRVMFSGGPKGKRSGLKRPTRRR